MTGQTIITYNGVTIIGCVTRRFDQVAQFDESDTDLSYYKITVVVSGLVHGIASQGAVTMTPSGSSNSAATHFKSVNYLLGEPRKDFEMRTGANSTGAGGTVLLQCQAYSATANDARDTISHRDLNNGPKTRNIRITRITADHAFRVDVEFELCMRMCDDEGGVENAINSVLTNRWSVSDDYDQNLNTTRTFTGRLRVATGLLNANDFRHLVVPPLASGMRRDKMRFLVSEDGLNLDYTITDKEVHYAPPAPATSWSYSHTEHMGNGKVWYGEISVKLSGDRNVNKKKLIQIAIAIVLQRSGKLRNANANHFEAFAVTDEYSDNTSSVSIYARVIHSKAREFVYGVNVENLGKPISSEDISNVVDNYRRSESRGHDGRGGIEVHGPVSLVGAITAVLGDPCSPGSLSIQRGRRGGSYRQSPESGDLGGVVDASIVDVLPDEDVPYLSEDHSEGMYEHYKCESTYNINEGFVHCPYVAPGYREAASIVVPLHLPLSTRTVRITAMRTNESPVFPKPNTWTDTRSGITFFLTSSKVLHRTSERTPAGEEQRFAAVEYYYAMSRPAKPGEDIPIGFNPWDNLGAQRSARELLTGESS